MPLVWGTMFISLIAPVVAVSLGTFSAIYLSEYACGRVHSVGKPMLEILACIPTIVYGLFALLTVGPLLVLNLPIGSAASIYLEKLEPKNRLTDLVEVNISNLAAVPSIVFCILGLSVFIQFMRVPQSAPLVGALC